MATDVNAVRIDALHPHRVPTTTPLGWVSNRHRRMVSVDLSPAMRAKQFEKQLAKAILSHAKWSAKRYLSHVREGRIKLADYDDRTLTQIMASYGVRPEAREYAVLLMRLEQAS